MDDAFVFYAYWNGNQIRDLFEGLVSVTAGSGFVQLAAFLVVTGLVAALLIGAVKGEGKHVISYFACAVLFWFVAIVPKASVVIEDVRSHTVYNVDNVPLSMAFFASVSSRIGHWLTQFWRGLSAARDGGAAAHGPGDGAGAGDLAVGIEKLRLAGSCVGQPQGRSGDGFKRSVDHDQK